MSDPTADSTASGAIAPIAPVLFKTKGRGKKAAMRKREPTPPPASDSDSDSGNDDSDGGGGLRGIKRRKKSGPGVISASTGGNASARREQPKFVADRKDLLADADVATKRSHMFDDNDKDTTKKKAKTEDAAPPTRSVGPVKGTSNIRTITFTDYTPDVCKDYKQTGFCGFGDNCKFLHARENFKQGWQLDNEWEAMTKGKKNLGGTIVASADRSKKIGGDDDDDDDDEELLQSIPFACIICKESYKQPVVTRCGHYFCERCALGRYRRDPSCAACGSATTGVFNNAKRLTKLLERKRERAAKKRQAAIDAGEEVSSEEEEDGEEE